MTSMRKRGVKHSNLNLYKGTKHFSIDDYLFPLSIGGHTKPWQVWRAAVTSAKSWDCLQPANPGEMGFTWVMKTSDKELFHFPGNSKTFASRGKKRKDNITALCFKPWASLSLQPSKTTEWFSLVSELPTTHTS